MPRRRLLGASRRLGVRVALFLGVALLPVGLIAVMQTIQGSQVARQRSDLTLLALTEGAALTERQQIQRALGLAHGLALTLPALVEEDRCDAEAAALLDDTSRYDEAGYVGADGAVACSSDGRRGASGDVANLAADLADPRPRVVLEEAAPGSGRWVLVASHPVPAAAGGGFAFVSMPHEQITGSSLPPGLAGTVEFITFNVAGDVLTASGGIEGVQDRLPVDIALGDYVGRSADVVTGADGLGRERAFAVVPILRGSVHAMGSWEGTAGLAAPFGFALPPWLFPILMWAISLVVAYVAVHRLVIRHMQALGRRMRAFAEHRRLPEDTLAADAPAEIVEMAQGFAAMADRIVRDEAEAENRLHEQKVLLREIHHRVKNNLQLISSIINMQMRQIGSIEARHVLRRVQDRVLGLATIHRNLYQTDGGTIRADVVLREIIGQLALMGASTEGEAQLAFDFDPLDLYPDQAVPLSLFVTEATTNAVKYIGRPGPGARPWIAVSLKRQEDGSVRVSIANSKGTPLRPPLSDEDGTGLGHQLIRAFAMQLEASPVVEETPEAYRIDIQFTPAGFEEDDAEPEPGPPEISHMQAAQ